MTGTIFYRFMEWYAAVFSPIYFVGVVGMIIVYIEWRESTDGLRGLLDRVLVIIGGWAFALGVYMLYWWFFSMKPQYVEDLFAVTGVFMGVSLIYIVWRYQGWGKYLTSVMVYLLLLIVPYILISVVWNISGHVAFTLAPAIALFSIRRRTWPILVIPAIMVVNRPIVNAHTWIQSIAGAVLALIVYWIWTESKKPPMSKLLSRLYGSSSKRAGPDV